ncbi:hypothetical protein EJ03DRAFT_329036 [Teratosphaeria nubilosa]|uniref:Uncharacterized protein n=1 Tax=Teratosphaeria nubilosa TaxID=161662 RepID=A0A6G1L4R6_9PEZI|nr:hypothetical protein EJ03DRAFT_329036 [Teratosphaeria nubilosa]
MPPPLRVLEDSDDDGDGVSLEPEIPATKSQPSGRQEDLANTDTTFVEEQISYHGLDGTNDQKSTTSTERLRKEIRSAERHLVRDSGDTKSSDSPAGKASKRRHTEAHGPGFGGAMTPERGVKRTKTLKTYGSKNRSALALPDDDGDFSRLRGDEHLSGGALVNGTIGRGFIEHEPNQMFNESGSTAVYGTASQERMLEAARGRGDGNDLGMSLPAADPDKSSSFPWSPSAQTQGRAQVVGDAECGTGGATGNVHVADDGGAPGDADGAYNADNTSHIDDNHVDAASKVSSPRAAVCQFGPQLEIAEFALPQEPSRPMTDLNHAPQTPRLRSSPRVEIPIPTTISAQKPTKGRERKLPDAPAEPLNSDEVAIGLPKECYVPRPSRRRTQALEVPIDYSVRPEKAAKIKRNKTTANVEPTPSQQSRLSTIPATDTSTNVTKQSEGVATLEAPRQVSKNNGDTAEDVDVAPETGQAWCMISKWLKSPEEQQDAPKAVQSLHARMEDDQHLQPPRCEPAISPPAENVGVEASNTVPAQAGDDIVIKPARRQNEASVTAAPKQDDEMFIKPAPKQKTKASKAKAKRRATTIFEDHVDFNGSQRTPSLSQRQAARQASLANDSDEDVIKPIKPRHKKVIDDDQDELALDCVEQQDAATAGPSKRGRGRPPKSPIAAKPESATGLHEMRQEAAGRGVAIDQESAAPKQPSRGELSTATPSKLETSALQAPTPSSEQAASDPAKPSTPTLKPAAAKSTHSPIKSSSKVTYRVGLSKKHRIPSLLRTMRPAKR